MAHARRKYSEAMDNDGPRTRHVLEKMQILYAVERRIKEEHLSAGSAIATATVSVGACIKRA